jgi:hypothetical protein
MSTRIRKLLHATEIHVELQDGSLIIWSPPPFGRQSDTPVLTALMEYIATRHYQLKHFIILHCIALHCILPMQHPRFWRTNTRMNEWKSRLGSEDWAPIDMLENRNKSPTACRKQYSACCCFVRLNISPKLVVLLHHTHKWIDPCWITKRAPCIWSELVAKCHKMCTCTY